MRFLILVPLAAFLMILTSCGTKIADQKTADTIITEAFRPVFHFTPPAHWMNDPNGLVYYNNTYHLFYQHFPDSTVWGPMHWGHATSTDLFHWKHESIALYPDSLGLIFSGSAVFDKSNTSGLGTNENPALVAMFTYHSVEKERDRKINFQYQGIAFSLDSGTTWKKYDHNPVLQVATSTDFRDPKVFWHQQSMKWIVILAVKDHVELYSSPDLKVWTKLSEFGTQIGAHGGVWECPDLFELKTMTGESKWIMIVSINPGGPNGGSATQYFTGQFDGVKFTPDADAITNKWIDHGPDDYAGVTFSNTPDDRKLFLGWMSNWAYAQQVPTASWRSAMTIPRELKLVKVRENYFVRSLVVPELSRSIVTEKKLEAQTVNDSIVISDDSEITLSTSLLEGSINATDFEFVLSNKSGQELKIGFDANKNIYYVDRSKSGVNNFSKDFFPTSNAPRLVTSASINFTIINDVASSEIFFDDGLTVMTSIYFPNERMCNFKVRAKSTPVHFSFLTVKTIQ